MPEAQTQPANSLTQVLGQSERVKDMVEECADDLSTVNAGLKRELLEGEISPAVEIALEKSEAVEGMYQEKRDKSGYSLFSELLIWPD
jgi:hypothetical protein